MKISKLMPIRALQIAKNEPLFKEAFDNQHYGATSAILLSLLADAMGHPGTEFTKYFPDTKDDIVTHYQGMLCGLLHRLEFKHFKVTRPDSKTIAVTYDIFYTEAELRDAGITEFPSEQRKERD